MLLITALSLLPLAWAAATPTSCAQVVAGGFTLVHNGSFAGTLGGSLASAALELVVPQDKKRSGEVIQWALNGTQLVEGNRAYGPRNNSAAVLSSDHYVLTGPLDTAPAPPSSEILKCIVQGQSFPHCHLSCSLGKDDESYVCPENQTWKIFPKGAAIAGCVPFALLTLPPVTSRQAGS
ncbi:hypothetical protein BDY17DRAFT_305510 [Neohortaea acidophila]|uniref:Uncharacterized protein n=1 Tax=Neohortaea acidophila TaxID=245834 RepID=A0A6A6PFS9_9PEZI|nr:uncharacterized protein BDY17DRAFT_305510 [Neohortaea acidophila]KAF2478616.1 hypothetical protein BDY17DRAFT_305510 [Neohortaea acidophila]